MRENLEMNLSTQHQVLLSSFYGISDKRLHTLHVNEFNRIMTMLNQYFKDNENADSVMVKFGNNINHDVIYRMIEICPDFNKMFEITDEMTETYFVVKLKGHYA